VRVGFYAFAGHRLWLRWTGAAKYGWAGAVQRWARAGTPRWYT